MNDMTVNPRSHDMNLGVWAMVSTAFLWSSAGLFIKVIDWHPFAIAAARSLVSSLVVLAWLKRPHFHWSPAQVGAALAQTATMLLFVAANKTTSAANAILLQYIGPLFTAIIGAWLLKERARPYAHYPGGHPEGYPDGPKNLFRNAYLKIAGNRKALPFPTFEDGHRAVAIVEALVASSKSEKWTRVRV